MKGHGKLFFLMMVLGPTIFFSSRANADHDGYRHGRLKSDHYDPKESWEDEHSKARRPGRNDDWVDFEHHNYSRHDGVSTVTSGTVIPTSQIAVTQFSATITGTNAGLGGATLLQANMATLTDVTNSSAVYTFTANANPIAGTTYSTSSATYQASSTNGIALASTNVTDTNSLANSDNGGALSVPACLAGVVTQGSFGMMTGSPTSLYPTGVSCNPTMLNNNGLQFMGRNIRLSVPAINSTTYPTMQVSIPCANVPDVVTTIQSITGLSSPAISGTIDVKCDGKGYDLVGMSCSALDPSVCLYKVQSAGIAEPADGNFSLGGGTNTTCPNINSAGNYKCTSFLGSNTPILGPNSGLGPNQTQSVGSFSITTGSGFNKPACQAVNNYFCHTNSADCDVSGFDGFGNPIYSPAGCNVGFCGNQVDATAVQDFIMGGYFLACPSTSPCGSFMKYLHEFSIHPAATSADPTLLVYPKAPSVMVDNSQTTVNTCLSLPTLGLEAGTVAHAAGADSCHLALVGGQMPLTAVSANPSDPTFSCSINPTTQVLTIKVNPDASSGVASKSGTFAACNVVDASGAVSPMPPVKIFGFTLTPNSSVTAFQLGQIYNFGTAASGLTSGGTISNLPTGSFSSFTPSCSDASTYHCATTSGTTAFAFTPWGPNTNSGSTQVKLCLGNYSCALSPNLSTSVNHVISAGVPLINLDLGITYHFNWSTLSMDPTTTPALAANVVVNSNTSSATVAIAGAGSGADLSLVTGSAAGTLQFTETINGYPVLNHYSINIGGNQTLSVTQPNFPYNSVPGGTLNVGSQYNLQLNVPNMAYNVVWSASPAGLVSFIGCPTTVTSQANCGFKVLAPSAAAITFTATITSSGNSGAVSSSPYTLVYDLSNAFNNLPVNAYLGYQYSIGFSIPNTGGSIAFPAVSCTVASGTGSTATAVGNCVPSGSGNGTLYLTPSAMGTSPSGVTVTICAGTLPDQNCLSHNLGVAYPTANVVPGITTTVLWGQDTPLYNIVASGGGSYTETPVWSAFGMGASTAGIVYSAFASGKLTVAGDPNASSINNLSICPLFNGISGYASPNTTDCFNPFQSSFTLKYPFKIAFPANIFNGSFGYNIYLQPDNGATTVSYYGNYTVAIGTCDNDGDSVGSANSPTLASIQYPFTTGPAGPNATACVSVTYNATVGAGTISQAIQKTFNNPVTSGQLGWQGSGGGGFSANGTSTAGSPIVINQTGGYHTYFLTLNHPAPFSGIPSGTVFNVSNLGSQPGSGGGGNCNGNGLPNPNCPSTALYLGWASVSASCPGGYYPVYLSLSGWSGSLYGCTGNPYITIVVAGSNTGWVPQGDTFGVQICANGMSNCVNDYFQF